MSPSIPWTFVGWLRAPLRRLNHACDLRRIFPHRILGAANWSRRLLFTLGLGIYFTRSSSLILIPDSMEVVEADMVAEPVAGRGVVTAGQPEGRAAAAVVLEPAAAERR